MPNAYDRGDLVRAVATFVASNSLTADPSQVWCLIIDGAGNRATHRYGLTPSQIVRGATGGYYIDIDASAIGDWAYRWEGTGGLQLAEETHFSVRPTFKL
jgi:hypothetical protein